MITLGIESSCDDTSVALVKDGVEVLASLVSSQIEIHRRFGGVVIHSPASLAKRLLASR